MTSTKPFATIFTFAFELFLVLVVLRFVAMLLGMPLSGGDAAVLGVLFFWIIFLIDCVIYILIRLAAPARGKDVFKRFGMLLISLFSASAIIAFLMGFPLGGVIIFLVPVGAVLLLRQMLIKILRMNTAT